MNEILLAVGVIFTVGHVILDLRQFTLHVKHPRDWLVLLSAVCLIGHVLFTGEAASWVKTLT